MTDESAKRAVTNAITAITLLLLAALVLSPLVWLVVHAWRWALA